MYLEYPFLSLISVINKMTPESQASETTEFITNISHQSSNYFQEMALINPQKYKCDNISSTVYSNEKTGKLNL
jgi:hypothetical protein